MLRMDRSRISKLGVGVKNMAHRV